MATWRLVSRERSERQRSLNASYEDVLGETYVFDSSVQNHKGPAVGDTVWITDGQMYLGRALVDAIVAEVRPVSRYRCPECGSAVFGERVKLTPKFRCESKACHAEFEVPSHEWEERDVYRLEYGLTWEPLDLPIPEGDFDGIVTGSPQHSIRQMVENAGEILAERLLIPGGFHERTVRTRIGQPAFRRNLLNLGGAICVFTGKQPIEVLEAAHLYSYSKTGVHKAGGGMMMRRDLHSLFDRGLVSIDPSSWIIWVSPKLQDYSEYALLHEQLANDQWRTHVDNSLLETHLSDSKMVGTEEEET